MRNIRVTKRSITDEICYGAYVLDYMELKRRALKMDRYQDWLKFITLGGQLQDEVLERHPDLLDSYLPKAQC